MGKDIHKVSDDFFKRIEEGFGIDFCYYFTDNQFIGVFHYFN